MADLQSVPGETACLDAMVRFMAAVMPSVPAYKTQENRLSEPTDPNYVMMTPIDRIRLSTNVDTYDDCQFTGSIADDQMVVTAVAFGALATGRTVFGPGVAAGTAIVSGPSGGGVGTYTVTPNGQTVPSRTLAAGVENLSTPTDFVFQMDFYGANSSDNAQTFATVFRDEYGASIFAGLPLPVAPLYTSDPKNMVFVTEAQQYQGRWMLLAHVQADFVVTVPKEFATSIQIDRVAVDAFYPA